MNSREEFHAAVGVLETTLTDLSLLLKCFRRLEETLYSKEPPGKEPPNKEHS